MLLFWASARPKAPNGQNGNRAFGAPEVSTEGLPFTDVPAGSWFEAPIAWAVANGITNGLSATQFGPTASCNRAQVVTFLYRAYN